MTLVEGILLVLILIVGALQYVACMNLARRTETLRKGMNIALKEISHIYNRMDGVEDNVDGESAEQRKEVGH